MAETKFILIGLGIGIPAGMALFWLGIVGMTVMTVAPADVMQTFGWLMAWGFAEFVLMLWIFVKTPALTYFIGSFTKRMILIHPRETHYVGHTLVKIYGGLARLKKRGFYIINPKHTYIEPRSKVPTAIAYGNFGVTLSVKAAEAAAKLKELGIRNANELGQLIEILHKDGKTATVNLLGETVDMAELAEYFYIPERSDMIEGEIQRRLAAQAMQKLKQQGNLLVYGLVAMFILIGLGLFWNMYTMGAANTVIGAVQGTQGVVGTATNVVNTITETPTMSVS